MRKKAENALLFKHSTWTVTFVSNYACKKKKKKKEKKRRRENADAESKQTHSRLHELLRVELNFLSVVLSVSTAIH